MVSPWVTTLVIVFGIIVAVACVVAYLRIYRSSGAEEMAQKAELEATSDCKSKAANPAARRSESIQKDEL
ncbi:hypothetical protein [Paenibacillus sp. GCM10027626]|uniref:hypothetical protein n=1 Tax=Paenibacillus sp. GCM10027626 TaxID=3273411 RepID=UPI003633A3B6